MKFVLSNREIAEEFFDDTRLLGIVATISDYQFCWQLNRLMGIDFRINNDIEIQLTRKKRDYFFTIYEFGDPAATLKHYLYKNRYDGEFLLPEFQHLDFLWLMKGDLVEDDVLKQYIESIRGLGGVQLVTELTNEKIKNKMHLVF
jgi:hypothetical protein